MRPTCLGPCHGGHTYIAHTRVADEEGRLHGSPTWKVPATNLSLCASASARMEVGQVEVLHCILAIGSTVHACFDLTLHHERQRPCAALYTNYTELGFLSLLHQNSSSNSNRPRVRTRQDHTAD